MPPKPQAQTRPKPAASTLNTTYLLAYNFFSALLWLSVLGRVAVIGSAQGATSGKVYEGTERFARLTQSLAGLEVLHSLLGVVRAPLLTTLMQVASRFLLVWGIAYHFPQTTRYSPAYSSMLVAWSVTEVIRYSYFVFALSGFGVPRLWTWLRYNTFLVLYPVGVASETWLIYKAIPQAEKLDQKFGWVLYGALASYVPGFYMLFTHMLSQRRKIMRSKNV
ncbi:tyrosine phosphatase-like protein [Massariosphaeria phaeospora]|uniref:Very-long-chain (3R)-3-hydroxyacyl-CoA dehydratase n=1 Tax=Massariosphaeria phaeospora TaxID=100035 RepID=A0A7C8MAI9_9PLEO|nr:tyrosine phosphatase-like protein [Massariosphaeria phaeospora]